MFQTIFRIRFGVTRVCDEDGRLRLGSMETHPSPSLTNGLCNLSSCHPVILKPSHPLTRSPCHPSHPLTQPPCIQGDHTPLSEALPRALAQRHDPTLAHSLTHSLAHSLTHSLTDLTHSLTHSLTSLTHSLTDSFIHSLTHSLTRSLAHSLTHLLTHSLTSLTHSLTDLTHSLTYKQRGASRLRRTAALSHTRSLSQSLTHTHTRTHTHSRTHPKHRVAVAQYNQQSRVYMGPPTTHRLPFRSVYGCPLEAYLY